MTIIMITIACIASFWVGHAHAVWQRHRFIQSLLSSRGAAADSAVVLDADGNVL